jgi:hypothetical protein
MWRWLLAVPGAALPPSSHHSPSCASHRRTRRRNHHRCSPSLPTPRLPLSWWEPSPFHPAGVTVAGVFPRQSCRRCAMPPLASAEPPREHRVRTRMSAPGLAVHSWVHVLAMGGHAGQPAWPWARQGIAPAERQSAGPHAEIGPWGLCVFSIFWIIFQGSCKILNFVQIWIEVRKYEKNHWINLDLF